MKLVHQIMLIEVLRALMHIIRNRVKRNILKIIDQMVRKAFNEIWGKLKMKNYNDFNNYSRSLELLSKETAEPIKKQP